MKALVSVARRATRGPVKLALFVSVTALGCGPLAAPVDSPAAFYEPEASVTEPLHEAVSQAETPAGGNGLLFSAEDIRKLEGQTLGFQALVALALRNNPATRLSWLQALSAREDITIAEADYYPSVSTFLEYSKSQVTTSSTEGNTNSGSTSRQRLTRGPGVQAEWLMFDFGAREARVRAERFGLIAANLAHNRAVQTVILSVQEAYFIYIALGALIRAQESTVQEATTNLNAAEERRRLGVATIADVLQARTQLSQAELQLETSKGRRAAVRGAVLTSVGLPPTLNVQVEEIDPEKISVEELSDDIETLLAETKRANPEIQAAAAELESSRAVRDSVSRSRWPRIGTTLQGQEVRRNGDWDDEYVVSASITFPLFTGSSLSAETARARFQAAAKEASLERTVQDQALAVWTEYVNTKTAEKQISVSRDFLRSARQNLEVAQGRYREGLGSILDVLEAQRTVQQARSAIIDAYATWYVSLARLKFEIGSVSPTKEIVGLDEQRP